MSKYEDYMRETREEHEKLMNEITDALKREMENPDDMDSTASVMRIVLKYQKEVGRIAVEHFLKKFEAKEKEIIPEVHKSQTRIEALEASLMAKDKTIEGMISKLANLENRIAEMEQLRGKNA